MSGELPAPSPESFLWPTTALVTAPFELHDVPVAGVIDIDQLQLISDIYSRYQGIRPPEIVPRILGRHVPLLSGRRKIGVTAAHHYDGRLYSGVVPSNQAITDLTNFDGAFNAETRTVIAAPRQHIATTSASFVEPRDRMSPQERSDLLREEETAINKEVVRGLIEAIHHAHSERKRNAAMARLRGVQAGAILGMARLLQNGLHRIGLENATYVDSLIVGGTGAVGALVLDTLFKKQVKVPKPLKPINSVLASTMTGAAKKELSRGRREKARTGYERFVDRKNILEHPPVRLGIIEHDETLLPATHHIPPAPSWHPHAVTKEKASQLDREALKRQPMARAVRRVGIVVGVGAFSGIAAMGTLLASRAIGGEEFDTLPDSSKTPPVVLQPEKPLFQNAPLPGERLLGCPYPDGVDAAGLNAKVSGAVIGKDRKSLSLAVDQALASFNPDCFVDYDAGSDQADGAKKDVTVTGKITDIPLPNLKNIKKALIIGLLPNGTTPGAKAQLEYTDRGFRVILEDPTSTATFLLTAG